jgi:chemotaxis signal transduction protein
LAAPSASPTQADNQVLDVIRTRFGPLELAVELHQVSSVLDYNEGHSLKLIDPAPRLGLRPLGDGHVGFVEPEFGPPIGIKIGEVRGFEKWTPANILSLPDWIANYLPDVLKGACGNDENGEIVWLLDLRKLTERG